MLGFDAMYDDDFTVRMDSKGLPLGLRVGELLGVSSERGTWWNLSQMA